jgi:hypothetical protein
MADAKREKTIDKAVDAGVERSGRDKQLEMEFKRLKVEIAAKEGEICGILELQPAERKDFLSRMNRNGFEFVVSSYDFDFHRDLISDDGRKALKKAIREHEQLEKELKRVDVSGVGRQEFAAEVTKESEVGMPDAKTLKLYTPEALKAKIEKMFYVNVETPSKEEERTIENLKKGNTDFVTLLEAYKQATFEEANAAGLQTEETKAAYAETLKKADQGAKEKEETTAAQAAPKSFWRRVGGFFSRK